MVLRRVLIFNSGSSGLKWSVLAAEDGTTIVQGEQAWAGRAPAGVIAAVLAGLPVVDAVGHRVVHGGEFRDAVVLDERTRGAIAGLAVLAPLHNLAALAGIDAVTAARPGLPQVAAFDTAFHATIAAAAGYALPWAWSEGAVGGRPLRRYGFHGLSVAYAVGRVGALRRIVVCHLGAGCSITAVSDGRSIDTTMGFTPLDGVMMATRSGAVDPGLLLYLLRSGITAEALERALNDGSGLLGVSGVSADLREVRTAALAGEPRAALACAMFVHQLVRAVGGMIAGLGGIDALVFTGGIGEHAPWVRAGVADALAFVGVELDAAANEGQRGEGEVAAAGSRVRVWVVAAREDLQVLAAVRGLLGAA